MITTGQTTTPNTRQHPVPTDYFGQTGWYAVPTSPYFLQSGQTLGPTWSVTVVNGQLQTTDPFSGNVYTVQINQNGYYVFQTMLTP